MDAHLRSSCLLLAVLAILILHLPDTLWGVITPYHVDTWSASAADIKHQGLVLVVK